MNRTATLTLTENDKGEINVNVAYEPAIKEGEQSVLAAVMNAAIEGIQNIAEAHEG